MTLWTRIKLIGAAVWAVVMAVLYLLWQRASRRGRAAEQRALMSEINVETVETRRADERRVEAAGAAARASNAEAERVRNETPKDDRRTGRLGGLDRVRDADNQD